MPQTDKFPSLKDARLISVDCETCDPDLKTKGPGYHRDGFIAGVAIATDGFAEYYPIAHEAGDNLEKEKVFAWLKEQLTGKQPKLFANATYDLGFLRAAGIEVNGSILDIQIAEPLLNESRGSYSLEALSTHYLKRGKQNEEMHGWIREKFPKVKDKDIGNYIWRAPGSIVAPYAIADVKDPLEIWALQEQQLRNEDLMDLFRLESRLIPMVVAMRERGVRVNVEAADKLHKKLSKQQARMQEAIGLEAPMSYNEIAGLFEKEGLRDTIPLTPTGKPSITKEWLASHSSPLAKKIQEIRHLDKLCNTFLKNVILDGNHNGRIHASFNQLRSDSFGTISGRFSSSNPNLQQIPVRSEEGSELRKLFLPDEGQQWGATDFSQIEFRLLTDAAIVEKIKKVNALAQEYKENKETDFHSVVAEMTGLPREHAKTITFAAAYGAGARKIALQLGVDEKEGKRILDTYHEKAPFVKTLSRMLTNKAERDGSITTILGRKRRFNKWESADNEGNIFYTDHPIPGSKRAWTYRALNAYIQGSAADVLKQSMVLLWEGGVCGELGAPHLTVHDELDFSVPPTPAGKEAFEEAVRTMETAITFHVPIYVDHGLGPNWGEAKG